MIRKQMRVAAAMVLGIVGVSGTASSAFGQALNNAFTYQGKLTQNQTPASGNANVTVRLFAQATGGLALGSQSFSQVPLVDGTFSLTLNNGNEFGALPFDGNSRWLEIEVNGQVLLPRQAITGAPYALRVPGIDGHSLNAADNSPQDALFVNNDGFVGIGTQSPTTPLSIRGTGSGPVFLSLRNTSDAERWRVQLNGNDLAFRETGTGVERVRIGTTSSTALTVAGTTTTNTLDILGGSDIAEPFEVQGTLDVSEPQPGMVVSINPEAVGELRIANSEYDRTVAGIISGANGVNVGMTLRQVGSVADGKHPVALTGRVWCLVDADQGPVVAGDLLTTSSTPGHAMKVKDHARASGAVIGKAMSSLDSGRGMVLVLVNLQ